MHYSNFVLLCACVGAVRPAAVSPPSILFVLIDDWGWNNFGPHAASLPNAAEIQTPVLNQLVADGVLLNRHYTFSFCSPSRSALHTGRNPIHVLNSDLAAVNTNDPVSGFAGIPRNMSALPSKLAEAGYHTIQSGKWHVGLATPDHTPRGRGYAQSLTYLDGANDYWTFSTADWCKNGAYTDLYASLGPAYADVNAPNCSQRNQPASCRYEDLVFTNFAVEAVQNATANAPIFLYFAPHNCHLPLEVPAAQAAKFAFINDSDSRQYYSAMVNMVDAHIGQVVDAFKAKGLWENTLMVVSADNGGPVYGPEFGCGKCTGSAGANNFPLRGGKHSNFEGGVRSNAFVSGGLVPAAMRGKALDGFIGIEDWYRTLCGLAGVDPEDARGNAAGLPPVEGFDQWPLLSGANSTPPRTEVWLGADSPRDGGAGGRGSGASHTFVQGLIRADGWKVLHDQITQNMWQGPFYPNATTLNKPWDNTPLDCGSFAEPTCLFNVFSDPTEHDNQADKQPEILAAMVARLAEIQTTVFSPDRGQQSPLACEVSKKNGGFVAPFLP